MKTTCLFIILLSVICGNIRAQESAKTHRDFGKLYQKHVKLDITTGVNFDLAKTSGNPAAAVLGTRNTAAPLLDIRFTHLFSRRIGWYAATRFKFFKSKNQYDTLIDQIMEDFLETFFTPLSTTLHIAYNAGIVYRLESARWRCYPRIGLGANYYGSNRSKYKEKNNEIWKTDSNGDTFCLELGASTHFMFSKKVSLLLDVSYQQPLNKVKATLLHSKNGEIDSDYLFRSSTYGRELNVSTGIGMTF